MATQLNCLRICSEEWCLWSLPTREGKSLCCASPPPEFDWLREHNVYSGTSEDSLHCIIVIINSLVTNDSCLVGRWETGCMHACQTMMKFWFVFVDGYGFVKRCIIMQPHSMVWALLKYICLYNYTTYCNGRVEYGELFHEYIVRPYFHEPKASENTAYEWNNLPYSTLSVQ